MGFKLGPNFDTKPTNLVSFLSQIFTLQNLQFFSWDRWCPGLFMSYNWRGYEKKFTTKCTSWLLWGRQQCVQTIKPSETHKNLPHKWWSTNREDWNRDEFCGGQKRGNVWPRCCSSTFLFARRSVAQWGNVIPPAIAIVIAIISIVIIVMFIHGCLLHFPTK